MNRGDILPLRASLFMLDGAESGKDYEIVVVVDEKGLNDAIGLELVATTTNADGEQCISQIDPFKVVKCEGNQYTFKLTTVLHDAGCYKVAFRMFPKNPDLPHRQDLCYVRWFS
jgi:hypothetical protein